MHSGNGAGGGSPGLGGLAAGRAGRREAEAPKRGPTAVNVDFCPGGKCNWVYVRSGPCVSVLLTIFLTSVDAYVACGHYYDHAATRHHHTPCPSVQSYSTTTLDHP